MIGASGCGYPYCSGPTVAATINGAMGISVLIVDDHPSFRASARMLLECEGYDVVGEAADGATAISEAARLSPDMVLVDVGLPDIDGFEVTSRLARNGGPAVVLTSSREGCDYGTMAEASGARGFITKSELSAATLGYLVG
jgi:DNA-binding NarL/FixJ family response regulator